MSEMTLRSGVRRVGGSRLLPAIVAVALLGATAAVLASRMSAGPAAAGSAQAPTFRPAPASPAFERETGIRIVGVGMSADGGLVDVRYTATNPRKAEALAHPGSGVIVLQDERDHAILDTGAVGPHLNRLKKGIVYYLLFRNSEGSVRRGDRVTVLADRSRLAHVPVN